MIFIFVIICLSYYLRERYGLIDFALTPLLFFSVFFILSIISLEIGIDPLRKGDLIIPVFYSLLITLIYSISIDELISRYFDVEVNVSGEGSLKCNLSKYDGYIERIIDLLKIIIISFTPFLILYIIKYTADAPLWVISFLKYSASSLGVVLISLIICMYYFVCTLSITKNIEYKKYELIIIYSGVLNSLASICVIISFLLDSLDYHKDLGPVILVGLMGVAISILMALSAWYLQFSSEPGQSDKLSYE